MFIGILCIRKEKIIFVYCSQNLKTFLKFRQRSKIMESNLFQSCFHFIWFYFFIYFKSLWLIYWWRTCFIPLLVVFTFNSQLLEIIWEKNSKWLRGRNIMIIIGLWKKKHNDNVFDGGLWWVMIICVCGKCYVERIMKLLLFKLVF